MNAFQFCLIQCCILTITLYGLVISELLRLKKNVADIFGIGLIFFEEYIMESTLWYIFVK